MIIKFLLLFFYFLTIQSKNIYINSNHLISNPFTCGLTLNTPCSTISLGINRSEEKDTLLIQPGIYSGYGNENIDSTKFHTRNLNIIGDGQEGTIIIKCIHYNRWLYSENKFIRTLNNLIIKNCSVFNHHLIFRQDGGALSIDDSGSEITLTSVIFENNIGFNGGAISIKGGLLKIVNCTFRNNIAGYWGGAIVAIRSDLTVLDSIFENNQVFGDINDVADILESGRGGAIFIEEGATLQIKNSQFISNSAQYVGGAVYVGLVPNLILESNDFINNIVAGGQQCSFCSVRGGALYLIESSSIITNCSFIGNHINTISEQETQGGALAITSGVSNEFATNSTILNCTFLNNSAIGLKENVVGGNGGAIYSTDVPLIIKNCKFISNYVEVNGYFNSFSSSGGAIYVTLTNEVEISNSLFYGNIANSGSGGSVSISSSSVILSSNKFQSNKVYSTSFYNSRGGAVFLDDSIFNISNCLFQENSALSKIGGEELTLSGNGGALFLKLTIGTIFNSSFVSNLAISSHYDKGSSGGAIYIDVNNKVEIISISCSYNIAVSGGGIYLSTQNELNLISTIFFSNSANLGGGMSISTENHNILLSKCTFQNNSASETGGALYLRSSNNYFLIYQCIFTYNYSPKFGGAIRVSNSNDYFTVTESQFIGNSAGIAAGAFYSSNSNQNITILNTIVKSSVGKTISSFYFGTNHDLIVIKNTLFTHNIAEIGSTIVVGHFNNVFQLINCHFSFCTGDIGSVFSSYADFNIIKSCKFQYISGVTSIIYIPSGYTASLLILDSIFSNNYGLISLSVGNLTIFNSIFQDTQKTVLSILETTFIKISNCKFSGTSGHYAETIYFDQISELSITNNSFSNNFANNGGSLSITNVKLLLIENNQFITNSASYNGGCIYLSSSNGLVQNNLFLNNSVESIGGSSIFIASSENIEILNNKFITNQVILGGGAIYWIKNSMNEPKGLKTNIFMNNSASYGENIATEVTQIVSQVLSYNITTYGVSIPPILITLLDYYNQTVASDSDTVVEVNIIESSCSGYSTKIEGSSVLVFHNGIANFSEIHPYCAPGDSLTLEFHTSGLSKVFSTNVVLYFRECEVGEYSNGQECIICEHGTYSFNTNIPTDSSICKSCPSNTLSCYGSTLVLKEGFWRISSNSIDIFSCPYGSKACKGGETINIESCNIGYEGPLCGVCQSGYGLHTATKTCVECSGVSVIDQIDLIYIIIVALLILFILYSYFFTDMKYKIKSIDGLLFYFIDLFKLKKIKTFKSDNEAVEYVKIMGRRLKARVKVYITMYQILSCLPFVLDFVFPNPLDKIASTLRVLNISISRSSSVSCSNNSIDFIDILIIDTCYPLGVLLLVWICQRIHIIIINNSKYTNRKERKEDYILRLSSYYFKGMLIFIYYILPSVTTTIFQTFSCKNVDPNDTVDGSDIYMTADYSISCHSSRYQFGITWAIIMIFIYPLGFPLYFFYLLYDIRNEIMTSVTPPTTPTGLTTTTTTMSSMLSRSDQPKIRSLYFLYSPYKTFYWWWEIMETFQRIMLAGVLVLIGQGSALQIIVGCLLTLLFLYLYARYEPFEDPFVLSIKILSYWQLFFVFWISLLIKVEINSLSPSLLGGLLLLTVFANILNDILKIGWTIISSWSIFQNVKKMLNSNEIELKQIVDPNRQRHRQQQQQQQQQHWSNENEMSIINKIDLQGNNVQVLVKSPVHHF